MNKTLIAIIFALSSQQIMAIEEASCLEQALTQQTINQCANINYKQADAELNRVYQAIKKNYSEDKLFLKKLKIAQKLWIQLRDADFAMQFPQQKEEGYYGSIFPTCASEYKTQLTQQRVRFLKEWLVGGTEGNTCNGSKKIQDLEVTKSLCYQNVHAFKDTPKEKEVIELSLNINGEQVTGDYNYLPFEKDQRLGQLKGTIQGNTIKAKYTFEQEGEEDSANLTIQLKDKVAVVQGDKRAEELGLLETITQTKCD